MYGVSSLYGEAVRSGGVQYVLCDAWRSGAAIKTGLQIVGGSVTDDSAPGVRRKLTLEIFPELGLFDLLAPTGTELRPRSVFRYPSGQTEIVPMGVFDVDGQSMSYGAGGVIQLSASDKWVRIQRARFLQPQASTPGSTVVEQIAALIRGALGASETVVITATSTALVGSFVWERDRDKAIIELAESIGAHVSFDRNGVATIQDLPAAGAPAVWTVDASADGVMLEAERTRDRQRTYNVVVAASDSADGLWFPPQYAWDNDPSSDTYAAAGSGAGSTPPVAGTGGPFGLVPYAHVSPMLRDAGQALDAARAILARVTGRASQMSLTAVRNHALDSLDTIDVLLPAERYDQPQPLERHVIDRVTHPLLPSGTQTIDTRSTRTDEFA